MATDQAKELLRLRNLVRRIKRIVKEYGYTDGNALTGFYKIEDVLKEYKAKK